MEKIVRVFVILSIVFIVCYYLCQQYLNIEGFSSTPSKTSSESDSCSKADPSLTDLGVNPLVDRQGQNIILTPSGSVNDLSSILIDSPRKGWKPTITQENKANLVVSFPELNKIDYIITSGIKVFKVYYSRTDNDAYSYDEVLYQNVNSQGTDENKALLHFESSGHDQITKFSGLTTSDGQPIFAKYIKIVPLTMSQIMDKGKYVFDKEKGDQSIGDNGMKVEIMGNPGDAKPFKNGSSLIGSTKFYDENGKVLQDGNWTGEKGNLDSKLKIVFDEDGHTVPKTVYSLIFTNGGGSSQWVQEFSLTYTHHKSKLTETIYNIKGNTNCGENNKIQYYFNHPIIATSLIIKPTKLKKSSLPAKMKIVDILGDNVNESQENAVLDKNKKKYCNSDDPGNCGSVSDLLGKQSEIQQLCDSLELQDRIKENNQRIQKNRQYIMQLEDQDKKIASLESVVNKMKHLRELRQKDIDLGSVNTKDKQDKIQEQLEQLIKDRQKRQRQFNVKLNIGNTLDKLQQQQGTGVANNTSTTSLEGFQNYDDGHNDGAGVSYLMNHNRYTHTKRCKNQNKLSEEFLFDSASRNNYYTYTPNMGFDYYKKLETQTYDNNLNV